MYKCIIDGKEGHLKAHHYLMVIQCINFKYKHLALLIICNYAAINHTYK